MMQTFLDKILTVKKERVSEAKRACNLEEIKNRAFSARNDKENHRLRKALQNREKINIIAEIKRASPSKGVINDGIDIEQLASNYENGGACAVSILTEEDFFKGSLDDLKTARSTIALPILQKDFVIDEFQIYEAAAAGADAILLIVAALAIEDLKAFLVLSQDKLGIDAIVEVHTLEELQTARDIGAKIIGVNNRDLRTFNVSRDVSRQIIRHRPPDTLMITESGLSSSRDISELRLLGFDGFLVGESLMRSGDPENELRKLATEHTEF